MHNITAANFFLIFEYMYSWKNLRNFLIILSIFLPLSPVLRHHLNLQLHISLNTRKLRDDLWVATRVSPLTHMSQNSVPAAPSSNIGNLSHTRLFRRSPKRQGELSDYPMRQIDLFGLSSKIFWIYPFIHWKSQIYFYVFQPNSDLLVIAQSILLTTLINLLFLSFFGINSVLSSVLEEWNNCWLPGISCSPISPCLYSALHHAFSNNGFYIILFTMHFCPWNNFTDGTP